ncbi:ceramidase domain-containing protein [Sphaerospermopsis aphanizomenoides BCCUSP55]|uniref:ceramidase domain-containing protein n=1 Tax=Sphaerospermopsis aphanizomenoides TaxID=459663 RepID=UPI001907B72E|nr:ceramidase domain-containing protein [Sphaerospermopsis aphanizomenoides]MBK1986934.1 ceramidase domain-containing protein [Sphaerospermopsis aphanizomenoides BCCUSP55]
MNDYIDLYCERILPGLWNEPLNAVSNISFFIAAWAIWQLAQRQQQKVPTSIYILIILTTTIGIGSTLLHTFAQKWAYLLDVIPIFVFQLCFLWLYSRQVIRIKYIYTGALLISFLFLSNFSRQFPNLLNGSLSYLPGLAILLMLGIYHYQKQKNEQFTLFAASGIFLLALSFRTLDQVICPYFSSGTHFLWHLFNGMVVYLSVRALILNWSAKAKAD